MGPCCSAGQERGSESRPGCFQGMARDAGVLRRGLTSLQPSFTIASKQQQPEQRDVTCPSCLQHVASGAAHTKLRYTMWP